MWCSSCRHGDYHAKRIKDAVRRGDTFYSNRDLNVVVIDYEHPERNAYEVTEEFYSHNGKYGTREDVSF